MRAVRLLAVAAVAAVVLVVGGIFVIHKIEGGSAKPLTLTTVTTAAASPRVSGSTTTTGASGTPVAVDGTWNVSSGSQAGYRIKETLFGVSNTAVGRTTALTGSITVAGTTVGKGSFTADLTKVTSDRATRDNQFQGRIMNTAMFPTATFTLTQPVQLPNIPSVGVQLTASATGDLNLHGVTKTVTFRVSAQRTNTTIQVAGSIPITFADYNIDNPSGGPATTADNGTLEFLINFSHA